MRRWRKIALSIFLILAALLIWEFLAFSSCAQQHNKQQESAAKDDEKYRSEACIFRGPIAASLRLRNFISRHSEAISSAVTAAATFFIAIFTWTLWMTNRDHLSHAREVERAYISGGGAPVAQTVGYSAGSSFSFPGGAGRTLNPLVTPTGSFQLNVNNHGKTPGELREIGIGFCDALAIPPTPNYTLLYFREWIGPGIQSRPIYQIEMPTNFTNPAIYGRFYYRDIFDDSHSSGFILRITDVGVEPILAPTAYTNSD